MSLLSDTHRRVLKETSGLTDAVIDARGYRTMKEEEIIAMIDDGIFRKEVLKAAGWMAIPVIRPDGVQHCEIIRLDNPITYTSEKTTEQRYVWPSHVRNAIDISPTTAQWLLDTSVPLIVTEGIKKGDAIASHLGLDQYCVASLNGCTGWAARIEGVSVASPDWRDIGLNKRLVIIVSDSDFYVNDNVCNGWTECAKYVGGKTDEPSKVWICVTPPRGIHKQGADDYLLRDSLDSLLSYSRTVKQVDQGRAVPVLDIVSAKEVMDSSTNQVDWLVDGILPRASIAVMAGHTRSYKTWHSLQLSIDMLTRNLFLKHPSLGISTPGSTLYFNREMGRPLLGARLHNLLEHEHYNAIENLYRLLDEQFFVMDSPLFDLSLEETQQMVIDFINAHEIALTIFDTFSMVWHGDENSSSEVGLFYDILRYIISKTGTTILLLHHLTKPIREQAGFDPLFALRGSGQIGQQADSVFMLAPQRSDVVTDDVSIKFVHAKGRAAFELPSFFSTFHSDPDSTVRTLEFSRLVKDDLASQVALGNSEKLIDWLLENFAEQEAMSNGDGMERSSLTTFFNTSYPKDLPTLRPGMIDKGVGVLVERGMVIPVQGRAGWVHFNPDYIKKLEAEAEAKVEINE